MITSLGAKQATFSLVLIGVAAVLTMGFASPVCALEYHGRLMTGAYASSERFSEQSSTGQDNDFATFSTRIYLEMSQASKQNNRSWELVTDVRDKHDFFDKLERELQTLTATNTFQLRQLAFRLPERTRGVFAILGRFPVTDAGAVYTDGAEVGYRINPDWSAAVFGGLNPKREDQSYVSFNSNSQVLGTYLLYQPNFRSWTSSFYATNSAVTEINSGQMDRLYWYENIVFQPNSANRFVALSYLDFVPTLRFQNANLSYSRDFNNRLSGRAGITVIDVIEYTRRQGVRDRLNPSPYREGALNLAYRLGEVSSLDLTTNHGVRLSDQLQFHEYAARVSFSRFISRHLSYYLGIATRRNFNSDDHLLKMGFGFYRDQWEISLDGTVAHERYDSGDILSPVTAELTGAWYLSKSIFGTLSLHQGVDSKVNIFSTFFKLGYRFGTKEIPAVRDGAPPRGKI